MTPNPLIAGFNPDPSIVCVDGVYTPAEVAVVQGGRLTITGDGNGVDASAGRGGLAARHDELHWFALEACGNATSTTVTARAALTVVVAREVASGHEQEFHLWVETLFAAARQFPGHLGSGLLEPVPGGAMWHVVYRFDSPEHLAAWESSDTRARLLARGDEFVQTVAVRRLDGMEAWFQSPGRPPAPPQRWKTFVMTATVILVLQFALSTLLRPLVGDWPFFFRTAVVIIPLVALMTWVVMPRLSRWLAGWLYRGGRT